MKEQLVKDWMTADPISISPDTILPEAQRLMFAHKIRRLPVVSQGELVGIVTFGDLREAKPSDASSLSVYELNFLLDQLRVREIMTPDPVTLSPDDRIRSAAQLMLEKKVGGIPVLEGGKLVGILTETDLCRMIVELAPQFGN